eukprot:g15040.t1
MLMLKVSKFLAATAVATPYGGWGRLRGDWKSARGARSQSKLTTGHADGFTSPEAGPKMADGEEEAGPTAFTAKMVVITRTFNPFAFLTPQGALARAEEIQDQARSEKEGHTARVIAARKKKRGTKNGAPEC